MIPSIPSTKCTRGPEYTSGGSRHFRYFSHSYSLSTPILSKELKIGMRLFSSCHIVLSCVVLEWGGLSHLFIAPCWSVWRNIEIRMQPTWGSPGYATWKLWAVGACRGAAAPMCCLRAIAFRMAVACWAWAASTWVWPRFGLGRWAFPLFLAWIYFTLYGLCTFPLFSYICPVKWSTHQNSWNSLV
jgi:hypothetical protein